MPLVLLTAFIAAICGACAHSPNSFRLTQAGRSSILVPPGVKDAGVRQAEVRLEPRLGWAVCRSSPSGLRVNGRRLIVTRQALSASTPEELSSWIASLETSGCIGSAEALALRVRLIDALPLDAARRRSLLTPSQGFNLSSVYSLRVVSPVFRTGADEDRASVSKETARVEPGNEATSIDVEVKTSADLIGYEIAWYDVRDRTDGPGVRIVARNAEVHVRGQVEQKSAPGVNQFAFGPDARCFRYFLMTRESTNKNDFNIVVLGAPTLPSLEERTKNFDKDAAGYLRSADKSAFSAMTPEIGVNPYLRVTVRNEAIDLELGATVGTALGVGRAVPKDLRVYRPHNGKLFPVQWDRIKQNIVNLPLEGGEVISWD